METEPRSLNEEVKEGQFREPISETAESIMVYRKLLTDANVLPEDVEKKCEAAVKLLGETGVPGSRARKQCFLSTIEAVAEES